MNFAPIVIPTLCRFDHFKRCIESLSKCKYCEKTDVYICLDYPSKRVHEDGYNRIYEYLVNTIFPFRTIHICKRTYNHGEDKNLRTTYIEDIFPYYDTWILSEDDNEFSPNFLEYMNYNLEKYKDDDKVYAVCGYNYPTWFDTMPHNQIYKSFFYSPWGAGFWVKKYRSATIDEVDSYLYNRSNMIQLSKSVPYLLNTLIGMRYSGKMYGDAVVRTRLFLEGRFCIFPVLSKVRNCGYDNSGINCYDDGGIHKNQEIDGSFLYQYEGIADISNVEQIVNQYYKISYIERIKSIIKYLVLLFKRYLFITG